MPVGPGAGISSDETSTLTRELHYLGCSSPFVGLPCTLRYGGPLPMSQEARK